MATVMRPRTERGYFDHGWLQTYHTFSFGHYFDRKWEQFRALRVMNEDVVAPGEGFGMHGHRDMEILTWVLSGALEHRDSLGHGAILRPGEMQWMSAGSGIRHSEFNPSSAEAVHLYQIWLLPDRAGHTPAYDQKAFDRDGRRNRWQVLASSDGRDGSLKIRQDATVSVVELDAGNELPGTFSPGRYGWLQVLRGEVELVEPAAPLVAGDGVGLSELTSVTLQAKVPAEVLLFDLK